MTPQTLGMLTNPEVIAVNQDPAGEQGIQVAGITGSSEIWCRPLGTNFSAKAVGLLNPSTSPKTITANWTDLGLQAGAAYVRDLWARSDLGLFTNGFTATVQPHSARLLSVSGAPPALPRLGTNFLSDLQRAYGYVGWGTLATNRSISGNPLTLNGQTYASGLGAHACSGVEYFLGGQASRFQADIGVDDEVGTNGSVVFLVYADGKKIFSSGVMVGGGPHQTVDLDISGQNRVLVQPQPRMGAVSFDPPGGNLMLSGSGGLPNGACSLLTSTNVALPADQWTPIATNWCDASGAFVFTNAPAANPAAFYRVRLSP
jgi:alpha-galactosidase